MKIKIQNVFEPEKNVEIVDIADDKDISMFGPVGTPNITISCKTKKGYPVFINMSKTACLAISFVGDTDNN